MFGRIATLQRCSLPNGKNTQIYYMVKGTFQMSWNEGSWTGGYYPGLSQCVKCNHKGHYNRADTGELEPEKRYNSVRRRNLKMLCCGLPSSLRRDLRAKHCKWPGGSGRGKKERKKKKDLFLRIAWRKQHSWNLDFNPVKTILDFQSLEKIIYLCMWFLATKFGVMH